jgi:hypothetical protein
MYRHLKDLYRKTASLNADARDNQLAAQLSKCIDAIAMQRFERAASGSSVPPL